jgi:mono/diheme cytochrome c family protein
MENKKKYEAEMDFEGLLKDPIRLFGAIYPYFIVIIIAGGIFWITRLGSVFKNEAPVAMLQRDTIPEPIPMKKGTPQEGVDVMEISQSTPELVTKGQELYKANCASCHGDEGRGDGTAGAGLNPKPRNFHELEGWKNGPKITEMFKTLEEGIAGGGMVAYEYLPVRDRFAMIHYIQQELMPETPEVTEDELITLDQTYKLAEGKEGENSIPRDMAKKKIVEENNYEIGKINNLARSVAADNSLGSRIIQNNTDDLNKALWFLNNNPSWKTGQQEFFRLLSDNFPANGFSAGVFRLSSEESIALHSYLLSLYEINLVAN